MQEMPPRYANAEGSQKPSEDRHAMNILTAAQETSGDVIPCSGSVSPWKHPNYNTCRSYNLHTSPSDLAVVW